MPLLPITAVVQPLGLMLQAAEDRALRSSTKFAACAPASAESAAAKVTAVTGSP